MPEESASPPVNHDATTLTLRFGNQVEEMDWRHPQVSMGRGSKNRFPFPEEEISSSRNHAHVEYRPGGFFLVDHSSNSTYVVVIGSAPGESKIRVHNSEHRLVGKGIICLGREMAFEDPYAIHYRLVVAPSTRGQDDVSSTRIDRSSGDTELPLLRTLQDSSLAEAMTLEECRQLIPLVRLRTLVAGESLPEEGETSHALYCIVSGALGVYAMSGNTVGQSCLHTLEAGDLAGEFGFVDKIEKTAALRAMRPTEILCLDSDSFDPFVNANPMIGYKLLRTILHSVRQSLIRLNLEKMDLETTLRRYFRKLKD